MINPKIESALRQAQASWHKLLAKRDGSFGSMRASDVLDANGCLGGIADEFSPATESGRAKIRALVKSAEQHGLCAFHRQPKCGVPAGKFELEEAYCPRCGKRPSYCRCRAG